MIDPILITGCARSGTSLIAGILHHCGAFGGKMSGPCRHNEKGMFENSAIRNNTVKPFLRKIEADALGQKPLPDIAMCKRFAASATIAKHWRNACESAMTHEGYTKGPWFYKGAKMCLMWPIWTAAFPDAKWVVVRRKDEEIIASCLRTGFMRAFKGNAGWQGWIDEHKKRFTEMLEAGADCHVIWPEDLLDGDLTAAKHMVKQCGLEWNEAAVTEFVTPRLWMRGDSKRAD